jgi:predicted DNA-binding transcriptional regulator AlpA
MEQKYLMHLTVDEFKILCKGVFEETISQVLKEIEDDKITPYEKKKTDTINVADAAELTGFKIKTIYSKVCRGEIPTLGRGRPLVFSRRTLEKWLRDGKPRVVEMMYEEWKQKQAEKPIRRTKHH